MGPSHGMMRLMQ